MSNRIYKFRAWDKRFKKFSFGSGDLLLRINSTDFEYPNQFTCLHDKNGKEIYEGDYLRLANEADSTLYRIVWNSNRVGFVIETMFIKNYWEYEEYDQLPLSEVIEEFEVVGNIYENPELLK